MILEDLLRAFDAWRYEFGDSGCLVVTLERSRQSLSATPRKINNKLRRHEARNSPSNMPLKIKDLSKRSSQILDATDHVALIHVIL